MAGVALRGVRKSFGGRPGLAGVDLEISDGELCVLVGPPGAGKTTLLRIIAGLEKADAGAVELDGEAVDRLSPRQRDVAMLFQADALLPRATVAKNIGFGLRARRLRRAEVEAQVGRIADLLGLSGHLDAEARLVGEVERRRAAIARAVIRQAGVCLLDQPLAGIGDEATRDRTIADIKLLHRAYPSTKLYVTPFPEEAMILAERTVVINEGRIEQDGTPLDLFERPKSLFVAGFFGSPKMNFVAGSLTRGEDGDAIRLQDGALSLKLTPNRIQPDVKDGLAVVLGIRPEQMARAIRISPPDGVYRHEAEVEDVRRIGARSYATFRIGNTPIVAELMAHDVTAPGERFSIDINLKRASLFDAKSGSAL